MRNFLGFFLLVRVWSAKLTSIVKHTKQNILTWITKSVSSHSDKHRGGMCPLSKQSVQDDWWAL